MNMNQHDEPCRLCFTFLSRNWSIILDSTRQWYSTYRVNMFFQAAPIKVLYSTTPFTSNIISLLSSCVCYIYQLLYTIYKYISHLSTFPNFPISNLTSHKNVIYILPNPSQSPVPASLSTHTQTLTRDSSSPPPPSNPMIR